MKCLLTLVAALLAFSTIAAQEYGRPDDLKGLKKVFVDTGTDLKNRERILREIEKAKLDLQLLDSAEGAEIVLAFGEESDRRVGSIITNPQGTLATPTYRKIATGEGAVFVMREGRARIVLSHKDEKTSGWEREPATNFGREFVKAYRKANGLKK